MYVAYSDPICMGEKTFYNDMKETYQAQLKQKKDDMVRQRLNFDKTILNPYKLPKSMIDDSLIMKPLISTVMAYGLGLAIGAFMNVHATDMVDYSLHRGIKSRSRATNVEYMKKIKGSARGFSYFGFFFTSYLTIFERLRTREDGFNDFMGGAFTSANLLLDTSFTYRSMFNSAMMGGVFCYAMDILMGDFF